MKNIRWYLFAGLVLLMVQACSKFYFRENYKDANTLMHLKENLKLKPFLKAHLKNGDVCILQNFWHIDTIQNLVSGTGIRYDFNRQIIFEGNINIPIDSVAIFETNDKLKNSESDRVTSLSILAGLDVLLGLICITNPKACFGSCPTFYLNDKDNFHYADAEGFSNAIAPSLEYFDIDALNNKPLLNDSFSITMKNEALETHCVNDVKLLTYPRKPNERIYHSPDNEFYVCENEYPLSFATGAEGNNTAFLKYEDRLERTSYSDSTNLSSKEDIYLEFDPIDNSKPLGLVVNFRQTLMTTYFIYSAIGFMGDEVGDLFAEIESSKEIQNKLKGGIKEELGNIEVFLWDEQEKLWQLQGHFYETGPIAINKQIIPLKNSTLIMPDGCIDSKIKLKININKGLWRIDCISLTTIKEKIKPLEISPYSISNKGKMDQAALKSIIDPDKYLIAMPGSEYKFNFLLPDKNEDYELFLYSKGYYLEWMRENWLKDKDLFKLYQLFENPKKYLREEAFEFKRYETTMESEFWNSKIDTKTFNYYDN